MKENLWCLVKCVAKKVIAAIVGSAIITGIKKVVKDKIYIPLIKKINRCYDDLGTKQKNFDAEFDF